MLVQREMVAGAGDTDARCHRVREAPARKWLLWRCARRVSCNNPSPQLVADRLLIKKQLDTETNYYLVQGPTLSVVVWDNQRAEGGYGNVG